MSEPSTAAPPALPPANPAFCSACGGRLPGPVLRCPRCGAVIGAQGGRGGSSAITIVAVVVAVLFGGTCLVGILAAIAIPNFIRYQLRSKQAEVSLELQALIRSENDAYQGDGHFVVFDSFPASGPGRTKALLSTREWTEMSRLGWTASQTYGHYRIAVATDEEGREAASLCAESDLDGDGVRAVYVAFLMPPRHGEPPPAPCTEPVPYALRYGDGQVVQITGPNVF